MSESGSRGKSISNVYYHHRIDSPAMVLKGKPGSIERFRSTTHSNGEIVTEAYLVKTSKESVVGVLEEEYSDHKGHFKFVLFRNGPGKADIRIRGKKTKTLRLLHVEHTDPIMVQNVYQESGEWEEHKGKSSLRDGAEGVLRAELNTWHGVPDRVEWSSSKPDVLSVSPLDFKAPGYPTRTYHLGLVKALRTGFAKILVHYRGQKTPEEEEIYVISPVQIEGPETLELGHAYPYTASSSDENDTEFSWAISNDALAEMAVRPGGRVADVTALRKGRIELTCKGVSSGALGTKSVDIVPPEVTVTIFSQPDKEVIALEEEMRLWAESRRDDEVIVETYSWSSDIQLFELETGDITRLIAKHGGSAVISAVGDDSGGIGVKRVRVAYVEITGESFFSLLAPKPLELKARTKYADDPGHEWTSSHLPIADVGPDGDVVGRGKGVTLISAKGIVSGAEGHKAVIVTQGEILVLFKKAVDNPKEPDRWPFLGTSVAELGRKDKLEIYIFVSPQVKTQPYDIYIGVDGPARTHWLDEGGNLVPGIWPVTYRKGWKPPKKGHIGDKPIFSKTLPSSWPAGKYAWSFRLGVGQDQPYSDEAAFELKD